MSCTLGNWFFRYAEETKEAQSIAESQSSTLNSAYRTLLSPVQRAQYILAQHGWPSLETEKLENPVLIMEIMNARESLDEATTLEEVEAVRSPNDGMMVSLVTCVLAFL